MARRGRLSQYGDPNRRVLNQVIEIELPCRIAVVSDSHSVMHPNTLPILRSRNPEYILHAGDIGRLEVLEHLSEVAPVIAVRGNIDGLNAEVPDDIILDLKYQSKRVSRWLLTHIAVRGPRLLKPVVTQAKALGVGLVVCGHSHVPLLASQNGVTVFNPGSVGPRRFQLPIVFGEVNLTPTSISCQHISCETGEKWLPGLGPM
jgi:putative phosphoesterase